MTLRVWSIGHGTLAIDAFTAVLARHEIAAVLDVRRFPGSRRHPQFGQHALARSLDEAGVAYAWIPELGGRRRADRDDHAPSAWRHAAFRAYAAHTRTDEFASGLAMLLDVASGTTTAMMCSETLWWRCHRRIVADVLVALGAEVRHVNGGAVSSHVLAPPARLDGGMLTYDAVSDVRSERRG